VKSIIWIPILKTSIDFLVPLKAKKAGAKKGVKRAGGKKKAATKGKKAAKK
jgi:hypothetical protein